MLRLRLLRLPKRRTNYLIHKETARAIITERVFLFAARYQFTPKRIAIRDTKRSWGSCSALGNLNFSYKLQFLPPCLRDYIVVHELCHLRHLNHGAGFWDEVAAIMPDARERAATLKGIERSVGTSMRALVATTAKHREETCTYCLAAKANLS